MNTKKTGSADPALKPTKNIKSLFPGGYVPRTRGEHEALPPSMDMFTRPIYRVGDGEDKLVTRPGAMHAYSLPTKGFPT